MAERSNAFREPRTSPTSSRSSKRKRLWIALTVLAALLLLAGLVSLYASRNEQLVDSTAEDPFGPGPEYTSDWDWDDEPVTGGTEGGRRGGGGGSARTRPEPSAVDLVRDSLREQLKNADIAFNAPDELGFGETAQIELALSPMGLSAKPEDLLSPGLPGDIETHPAEYARKTQATLSGPDFEIDPFGPQVRTILEGRPTVWSWTVVPTAFGLDKQLTLKIDAILIQDGQDMPPVYVRTFNATIDVRVGLWGWLTHQAGQISAVHGALGALGALGATAVAGLAFLRRRLRRPEKRRPVGFRPPGQSDD